MNRRLNRRELLQLCFGLVAGLPFLSLFRGPRLEKWSEHWTTEPFYGRTTHTVSGCCTKAGRWIDEASFHDEDGYQREIEELVKVPVGFERSCKHFTLINHGAIVFTFTDTATMDYKCDRLEEYARKLRLLVAQRT